MSRFVSAGTEEGGEEEPSERDEAWIKAQELIDSKRKEKAEVGKQEGGKSLYEVLQANKAAKQDAFEESARLRNQFRSLDEDEVEFLDSVLETTRAKEAEVKKETKDQLDAFRRQQEEAEKAMSQQDMPETSEAVEAWTSGPRKRKKGRENTIGGVKLRRKSTADETSEATKARSKMPETSEGPSKEASKGESSMKAGDVTSESTIEANAKVRSDSVSKSPPAGLGLVAYSSDEDD